MMASLRLLLFSTPLFRSLPVCQVAGDLSAQSFRRRGLRAFRPGEAGTLFAVRPRLFHSLPRSMLLAVGRRWGTCGQFHGRGQ